MAFDTTGLVERLVNDVFGPEEDSEKMSTTAIIKSATKVVDAKAAAMTVDTSQVVHRINNGHIADCTECRVKGKISSECQTGTMLLAIQAKAYGIEIDS